MNRLLGLVLLVVVIGFFGCNSGGTGGSGSRVTGENYLKIHNDMNWQDVQIILGPPTEDNLTGPDPRSGRTLVWKEGNKTVKVFINGAGSVTSKWNEGL